MVERAISLLNYREYESSLIISLSKLERKIAEPKVYSQEEAERAIEALGEMGFVKCPGGTVTIGQDKGIKCSVEGYRSNETPKRQFVVKPFYVSKTTVTNAKWAEFDPEHGRTAISRKNKSPVTCISYRRALRYIEWLNGQTEMRFCLPTEPQIVIAYAPNDWKYSYKEEGKAERCIQNVYRSFPEAYPEGELGATLEVDDPRVPVNYLGLHHAGGNISVFTLGHYQTEGHWGANSDGCYTVVHGGNFRLCHFSTRNVVRGIIDVAGVTDTVGIRLVHSDPFGSTNS